MYIKKIGSKKDIINLRDPDTILAVLLGGAIKSETGEHLYSATNVLTVEELQDLDCICHNLSALIIEGRK